MEKKLTVFFQNLKTDFDECLRVLDGVGHEIADNLYVCFRIKFTSDRFVGQ